MLTLQVVTHFHAPVTILRNLGITHSDTLHSLPLGQLTSKSSVLVNIHIVGKYPNSQSKDR